MSDDYHLEELRIARDATHPRHLLPPEVSAGARVLDIGCGAGQTLIAAYPERITYGLDPDLSALRLGKLQTQSMRFVCGQAEALPYLVRRTLDTSLPVLAGVSPGHPWLAKPGICVKESEL